MTDEVRWYLLTKKKAEAAICEAFRRFREYQIEPILIKGWAAARNYPPDKTRFFGDIDLAVSAHDYDAAEALVNRRDSPVSGVDLHRELRHLDTVEWDSLFANSEVVRIDDEFVRVLSAEDHLRVLCSHWLTNGGESRERLWDIVYAIQNRPAAFDWAKCLDVVSVARRSWVIGTIGLAHKYLDLDLTGLPIADEARRVPDWLTRAVEKSWASETKLRGIDESITKPGLFFKQIGKRLPPNAIQATVFCEGIIDDGSRVGYQVRDIVGRSLPSIRRFVRAVSDQYRWRKTK